MEEVPAADGAVVPSILVLLLLMIGDRMRQSK